MMLKALISRIRPASQAEHIADSRSETPGFVALDNRRSDMRLALVLLVGGLTLALPALIGVTLAPTTLVILASLLVLFVSAYSRYARQMRASRPEPIRDLRSAGGVQADNRAHVI